MELPDPYLPGAVSLLDQLDKKLVVFANLVLHETLERIHVDKYYGDISRGIFLIRGENVVLAGEIDETQKNPLIKVSIEEILRLQAEKLEEKNRFNHTKQQFLRGSGKVQPLKKNDEMMDEY
uniref:Uncharacterized protein n=1 Tax=Meloidogyne enterolobii TaxID=390850 RepID=A0A6V7V5D6_MELEN|nr:unnamed protein product [Meloidogyne enterolobii]